MSPARHRVASFPVAPRGDGAIFRMRCALAVSLSFAACLSLQAAAPTPAPVGPAVPQAPKPAATPPAAPVDKAPDPAKPAAAAPPKPAPPKPPPKDAYEQMELLTRAM